MNEEEKFINDLYEYANEELKEVYKQKKENKDEILKNIAEIMLTYTVLDSVMSLSNKDKNKEYTSLSKLITSLVGSDIAHINTKITDILSKTVKGTFNYYSYNSKLKDIKEIVAENFKGKHFSERVWDNESEVAKKLNKQVKEFINGNINVNQIKKEIEKTFNNNAYEVRRLVETEVNRVEDEAFRRFCRETGVKRVKRNEVLDAKTCNQCAELDGKEYTLSNAPGVVHPCCRGFNTVLE